MSKKILLAGVLPFLSNPVVLAAVGIGAVGLTLYEIFSDKDKMEEAENEQSNGTETVRSRYIPSPEPFDDWSSTAYEAEPAPWETVEETVEETVKSTVPPNDNEPLSFMTSNGDDKAPEPIETVNEEAAKKELIRKAMSELGKRSAAARRKKNLKI